MAGGLTAAEIGVSDALIEAFGETVFRLSHNDQRRRGDPIRERDFDEVERQRAELGLSDGEIAARIGLTRAQVIHIRNVMEWRYFRTRSYHRLNVLGGGRRYRPERLTTPAEQRSLEADAQALRAALSFDAAAAQAYVTKGWWQNDTLRG